MLNFTYSLMTALLHTWKRLNGIATRQLYLRNERLQTRSTFKRKLKILFSDRAEWKQKIRVGFRSTQHQITFGELTLDSIKAHHVVVPLTVNDLKYLNQVRHLIVNNPVPIPSLENLLLCDDKYQFNRTLIDKGFGNFIPQMGAQSSYPYILKKSIDEWGQNTHIIFDAEQKQSFSEQLNNPDYFSQALVKGAREYATHILMKDQKIVCSLTIEYGFKNEMPVKGKDVGIYRTISSCDYLGIFAEMLSSISFEGLCCVNYKILDDRPMIFEINPRFGASLCPFFFSFLRHLDYREAASTIAVSAKG